MTKDDVELLVISLLPLRFPIIWSILPISNVLFAFIVPPVEIESIYVEMASTVSFAVKLLTLVNKSYALP